MKDSRFVSRGGIKLQAALDHFCVDVRDKDVLDIGSSTGGFIDCLLQNSAAKVYSVDTAYGQLDWKLRCNPKVTVLERTNALYLEHLPGRGKVDLITVDAGWTKLGLVLPAVKKFLKPNGEIIALLKPHYEADKSQLYKGVVVEGELEKIRDSVIVRLKDLGFKVKDVMESPILGSRGKGNKECLLYLRL